MGVGVGVGAGVAEFRGWARRACSRAERWYWLGGERDMSQSKWLLEGLSNQVKWTGLGRTGLCCCVGSCTCLSLVASPLRS